MYNLWSSTEFYVFLSDNAKVGPDGSVLTIAKARPENQGQYRCMASNSAGRSTAMAVLNVKCELLYVLSSS